MSLPYISIQEIEYESAHEYQSRRTTIIAFACVLLVLCYVAVSLRILARRIQGLRLGWDDYTVLIALALVTAMAGVLIHAVKLGLGTHVIFIGARKGFEIAKMLYILEILLAFSNLAVKWSILLLYNTIFGGSRERWFQICLRTLAIAWLIQCLLLFFLFTFQCIPIYYAWTTDHAEKCLNLRELVLGLGISGTILNFFTIILPLPLIWELRLSWKTKIGVSLLFCLAGVGLVTCAIRASQAKSVDPKNLDFTWLQAPSIAYMLTEMSLGLICACAPTFRPILKRFCSSVASYTNSGRRKYGISTAGSTSRSLPFVLRFSARRKSYGQMSDLNRADKKQNQDLEMHSQGKGFDGYDKNPFDYPDRTYNNQVYAVAEPRPSGPYQNQRRNLSVQTDSIDDDPPPRYPSPAASPKMNRYQPMSDILR